MIDALSRRGALALSAGAALLAEPAAAQPQAERRAALDAAIDAFFAGWRTGDWSGFLSRCAEEMTFQFPVGAQRGRHLGQAGKAAITAWCAAHAESGNRIAETVADLRLYDGDWAVICDRGTGRIQGQPYTGLHAIFMRADARGLITEFREYFGEI